MDGDYLKLLKIANKRVEKRVLDEINLIDNIDSKRDAVGKALLKYLENEIDFMKKKLFILEFRGRNVSNQKIMLSMLENKLHFFKSNYAYYEFSKIDSLLVELNKEVGDGKYT